MVVNKSSQSFTTLLLDLLHDLHAIKDHLALRTMKKPSNTQLNDFCEAMLSIIKGLMPRSQHPLNDQLIEHHLQIALSKQMSSGS